uniref:Ig-like domain-containing protein n=1 Tax=Myotis lucifugus TaxID=59463 RepID=G1Q7Y6_MYOLU
MESLSAPICRGPVPWQGLLLAVSLLNFWSLPTTAQLAIVSTNAAEGQDVTLRIRNMPPNAKGFTWYRGEGANIYHNLATLGTYLRFYTTGPAHSGREQINYDGSLQLKQVTQKDTGIYTVVVYLPGCIKEIGFGQLNVYERVRVPTLIASNTIVTEHKDSVVLTCDTNAVSTQWLFNGMNLRLKERMKLSWNDRTLTIDPVRREDAGSYQCEVSNPISTAYSAPVELDCFYNRQVPVLRESKIHIYQQVNLKIKCKIQRNETDSKIWITSMKPHFPTKSSTMPKITPNGENQINCSNNQSVLGTPRPSIQENSTIQEPLTVPTLRASNTIVTEHKDSVVLTCYTNAVSTQWFFNGMNLRLTERMKLSWNDRTLTIDPVRREDAGNYQCEVSNPISSADSYPVELDVKY